MDSFVVTYVPVVALSPDYSVLRAVFPYIAVFRLKQEILDWRDQAAPASACQTCPLAVGGASSNLTRTIMNNRIKVGEVYFELPAGAAKRPIPVAAEKPEVPDTLDPVAFAAPEPDSVDRYIVGASAGTASARKLESAEPALDRLTAWQAFAGVKSTQPRQWLEYADGRARHCGFNMTAWAFGFQWFMFHRLYAYALLAACAEVSIVLLPLVGALDLRSPGSLFGTPATMAWIVLLLGVSLPRLAMGYWANIALYKRANRQIEEIQRFKIDRERKLAMITAAGSGNVAGLIMLYIVIAVVKIIAMNR